MFPEGVRVEYKREITNVPKVISSFANTVGGVWIIGVDADKRTNRAVLLPVGLEQRPGIEEQIVQSAQTGIYPAITPAIRLFEIPDQPGRVVAVVKIPESIEAPHAIENSTRVWVRTASTTEPYELADIERVEYLLRRRREPEQRREDLIRWAAARSFYKDHSPRVRIVISPLYPRGVLLPHDELYQRAELLEKQGVYYLRDFRLVHEALASPRPPARVEYYFEVSIHGVVFFEAPAEIAGHVDKIPFVLLGQLLYPAGRVLNTALGFLQNKMTNVLIRYELVGWNGIAFMPTEPSRLLRPDAVAESRRCTDEHIVVSTATVGETLADQRVHVLTRLVEEILWAFNYRADDLSSRVYATLQSLRLI